MGRIQVRRGMRVGSPEGQISGQIVQLFNLPFVLARNMAMVTVAPAASIAAMKAADERPEVQISSMTSKAGG